MRGWLSHSIGTRDGHTSEGHMEYTPFEKGIEVNGQTVWAIVDGFKAFTLMASQYLLEEKIGESGGVQGLAGLRGGHFVASRILSAATR
mgnify:CR=1 FL=1